MSEWISVKERLPEKAGTYLVYMPYTNREGKKEDFMEIDTFLFPLPFEERNQFSADKPFFCKEVGRPGKITHWTPLPSAPKETRNE